MTHRPDPSPDQPTTTKTSESGDDVLWWRFLPYFGLHLLCLGVIWVGISPVAVVVAVALYLLRIFFVTAFYHRYFSHRAFKTSRPLQFIFACLSCTTAQRGPLWWASHHREHHAESDGPDDVHSPMHLGFWLSHMGWFMQRKNIPLKDELIKDWLRFPELRWIEKFDGLPFLALGAALFGLGELLATIAPTWGTNGWQLLVWGWGISTVAVYHGTYTINSLAHLWGSRRFETKDDSRNNFILALVTLGEGWHNNHHKFPGMARQGLKWWEVDITYYTLKLMSFTRLIWDLRPPPAAAKER